MQLTNVEVEMEASSIITQVTREEDQITSFAQEKGKPWLLDMITWFPHRQPSANIKKGVKRSSSCILSHVPFQSKGFSFLICKRIFRCYLKVWKGGGGVEGEGCEFYGPTMLSHFWGKNSWFFSNVFYVMWFVFLFKCQHSLQGIDNCGNVNKACKCNSGYL